MTPVLAIPFLTGERDLIACVESIDTDVRLLIIDNSDEGIAEQWDAHVIELPANIGVAASWNLAIKCYPHEPFWLIANHDTVFAPGDLDRLIDEMQQPGPRWVGMNGDWRVFGINAECVEQVGWFDESFVPVYCLTPETPVLTSDLRWVPIGSVTVGDELIGLDEYPVDGDDRRYRKSHVTQTSRRTAPCLRLTLEDGRSVVCTYDHKWLVKVPRTEGGLRRWQLAASLRPGHRLHAPLNTWETATTFDAGWLSGILDGEGCLHHTKRMSGINIAQKPGLVLDRVMAILHDMDMPFTSRIREPAAAHLGGVATVEVSARRKAMELIGSLRPVRLNRPELWEGRSPRSRLYDNDLRIVSIEDVGERDVVSIETTTHTFFANGITSHNCEDADYERRCTLADVPWYFIEGGATHVGSASIREPRYAAANARSYPANRAYFRAKWGGDIRGGETFATPFGQGGHVGDWRLDLRRLRDQAWSVPDDRARPEE